MPSTSRRPLAFIGIAVVITFVLLIGHYHYDSESYAKYTPAWLKSHNVQGTADQQLLSGSVRSRLAHVQEECKRPDPFEAKYGRKNLRMTRGYEGSLARTERFIQKVLRGDKVKVGVIGGSITKGHHVYESERWPDRLHGWFKDFYKPEGGEIPVINGAAPATGSDYFSYCFALHIPEDVDLVVVELGVNDQADAEHHHDMERLLRGLLDLDTQPAVVLLEALGFSGAGMGGGGGRYHLPVAQYYDVPVINQRHPLASHFARFPSLIRHFFAEDGWGNPDMRHFNARGHRDAKNILASFMRDATCNMVTDPDFTLTQVVPEDAILTMEAGTTYDEQVEKLYGPDVPFALRIVEDGWAEEEKSWEAEYQPPKKTDDDKDQSAEPAEHKKYVYEPGMWTRPVEFGLVPRMEFLAGWNPDPDYRVPLARPVCYSTKATEARYNLTPVYSDGWEHWQHPDHTDKPYLLARVPGARVTLEIATHAGTIKLYYLKSERMSLGKIRCWVDDDEAEGKEGVLINGYWAKDWLNIGQYATIAEGLKPGVHRVNCLNLNETDTADGGHDFRMIGLVSS